MAERGLREKVKVGPLGKVKTALQMISISLLIVANPGKNIEKDIITQTLGYSANDKAVLLMLGMASLMASSIITVISGMEYFAVAFPLLLRSERKEQ